MLSSPIFHFPKVSPNRIFHLLGFVFVFKVSAVAVAVMVEMMLVGVVVGFLFAFVLFLGRQSSNQIPNTKLYSRLLKITYHMNILVERQ